MEFGIGTFALALAAGVLSILSPCVLPLVPILATTALNAHRLGALALAAGLMVSFTVVGLFVATIGFAIGLDLEWFRVAGALILIAFGVLLLSAQWQRRLATGLGPVANAGENLLNRMRVSGLAGQFLLGTLLGVVWSPCVGPTLGAASALAAQGRDLPAVAGVMLVFGMGAAMPVAMIGTASRQLAGTFRARLLRAGAIGKHVLGAILLVLGLLVLSGADKRFEAFLVEHSPQWLTDLTTRY